LTLFNVLFNKPIGPTQALLVLFASIVIGLIIASVYLSFNLSEQRLNAYKLAEEIITVTEGGATSAVWNLDKELADQVINSILSLSGVQSASLADDNNAILAQKKRVHVDGSDFLYWFSRTFIGDDLTRARSLDINVGNKTRVVGTLLVTIEPATISHQFLIMASTVLLAGLLQAISIALLLLWLSAWLVTSPLRRITNAIADIDPDKPEDAYLPDLPYGQCNELGQLLSHTRDIFSRLALSQQQFRHLATRDPLTNKPNRSLITDRLTRAITASNRTETLVAVLFMDLDRFKHINDSLGHNIGDMLLVSAANRLSSVLLNNDSVGRLGGDEFLVILEDIHDVSEILQTVQRITDALLEPFFLQKHEVKISASIGVSVCPIDADDINSLMKCADLAMHEAKVSNQHWHFFAKELSQRAESRLRIEAALDKSLKNNKFELYFQPKIDGHTQELAGCEALFRWHENPESHNTEQVINIAEESNQIIDLGYWVLDSACYQIKQWDITHGGVSVAINISAKQLQQPDFVDRLFSIIDKYQVNPQLMELEITESVLLHSIDNTISVLTRIQERGIIICIDDFGTGYSSLSYLTQLPIDVLKIDQSFISGPKPSKAVLETIVAMAKTLNVKTVAEGVETKHQYDWLRDEGCDYLQGYLISRPIPVKEFERYFLDNKTKFKI
jgi:diguanylate cyclase (GGDEF)-like protein